MKALFNEEESGLPVWQQSFKGFHWFDMPPLAQSDIQKLNFALYRRGLYDPDLDAVAEENLVVDEDEDVKGLRRRADGKVLVKCGRKGRTCASSKAGRVMKQLKKLREHGPGPGRGAPKMGRVPLGGLRRMLKAWLKEHEEHTLPALARNGSFAVRELQDLSCRKDQRTVPESWLTRLPARMREVAAQVAAEQVERSRMMALLDERVQVMHCRRITLAELERVTGVRAFHFTNREKRKVRLSTLKEMLAAVERVLEGRVESWSGGVVEREVAA